MSILFAGSSLADFVTANTPTVNTTAANIAPYVKEGVNVGGTTQKTLTCDFDAVADLWAGYHQRVLSTTSGTAVNCIEFFSTAYSTVNALFRLRRPSETTWRLEYYNGSAWVTTEATFGGGPGSDTALHRLDLHLVLSNTVGLFEVYKDGALLAALSVSDTILTAATTINRIRIYASGYISTTTDAQVSGVIVANEDTRPLVLTQLSPTGAGATSGWTGAYTDIDETGFSDVDFIESLTAAQVSTFAFEDMPAGVASHTIEAVVVAGRGRVGVSSPTSIGAVARVGATDYDNPLEIALDTSYSGFQSIMAINPATSAAWSHAAVNSAEFGVKSIA